MRARGMASRTSGTEVLASSFGSNTSSASAGTAGHRFQGAPHSEQAAAAEDAVKEMHWQARPRCQQPACQSRSLRAPVCLFNGCYGVFGAAAATFSWFPSWQAEGRGSQIQEDAVGLCRCAVACRAQEAQAAKQGSCLSGAVGVTFEFNDSARSLAVARQGAAQRAGGEGACRFLYQTQDPWCVITVVLSAAVAWQRCVSAASCFVTQ